MRNETSSAVTLVLEASTAVGSVAVFRGPTLLARADVQMGASAHDRLFPAVQAILEEAAVTDHLDEVVCGAGPGSFTSLRIAAALAKGLAHARSARLYAVPSLLLAAASRATPGAFLVHADALRGERYILPVVIDAELQVRARGALRRVTLDALPSVAEGHPLLSVGPLPPSSADGMSTDVVHADVVHADAALLYRVAEWRSQGHVDLASWEPAYGRLAEAQVKWEASHARPLPTPA